MTGMTPPGDFAFVQLHHVQLAIPAGGEDECRAFWGEALGMTELTKPPVLAARGGCWFRVSLVSMRTIPSATDWNSSSP
jgi:hypothetical protein